MHYNQSSIKSMECFLHLVANGSDMFFILSYKQILSKSVPVPLKLTSYFTVTHLVFRDDQSLHCKAYISVYQSPRTVKFISVFINHLSFGLFCRLVLCSVFSLCCCCCGSPWWWGVLQRTSSISGKRKGSSMIRLQISCTVHWDKLFFFIFFFNLYPLLHIVL